MSSLSSQSSDFVGNAMLLEDGSAALLTEDGLPFELEG